MPKARHSVSSSSAHQYGSLSYHGDDNEDNDASRGSTPSPTTYLNVLSLLNYHKYDIPTPSNKTMIFSSSDKPLCSIKRKKCMRKLEE
ncbi:hypothetical protein Tco_1057301, partial [Tanacetum coccineum]